MKGTLWRPDFFGWQKFEHFAKSVSVLLGFFRQRIAITASDDVLSWGSLAHFFHQGFQWLSCFLDRFPAAVWQVHYSDRFRCSQCLTAARREKRCHAQDSPVETMLWRLVTVNIDLQQQHQRQQQQWCPPVPRWLLVFFVPWQHWRSDGGSTSRSFCFSISLGWDMPCLDHNNSFSARIIFTYSYDDIDLYSLVAVIWILKHVPGKHIAFPLFTHHPWLGLLEARDSLLLYNPFQIGGFRHRSNQVFVQPSDLFIFEKLLQLCLQVQPPKRFFFRRPGSTKIVESWSTQKR